ncbi:MAG: prephenate dehydratase [Deltaproteobacteria bacterium]|nr:prephenate dehydratase [Deltaproteobacteria bacterium]
MSSEKIKHLREEIDQLDQSFLKLLSQRGEKVMQIGQLKKAAQSRFHVPEREAKIFQKLKKNNPGPYKDEAILSIFREILSASLALESPLQVAFLGPEATFTHLAAIQRFGLSAQFVPQETIAQVFQAVQQKKVNYGIVPIENSTEGVVNHTLDLFVDFPLKICGEIKIAIVHNLLSQESDLRKIKKVYSHPHALAQCRQWLTKHLPQVKIVDVASTAKAAEIVSGEKQVAAIASEYAASKYKLKVLCKNIEDHPNNFTRFVVIGEEGCGPSGHDKTSLMFSTKDEVGVLFKLLAPFAKEKINLTKIESRPLKGRAWEYIFFVDLDGHQEDPKVRRAIETMAQSCSFLRVLGSYPKSEV